MSEQLELPLLGIPELIPAPDDAAACELLCTEITYGDGIVVTKDKPYHHENCPIGKKLRDSWCTPKWLTDLLPLVTLDPCSNPYSTVRCKRAIQLEPVEGEPRSTDGAWTRVQGDGLVESWKNRSVFCNPPYSDVMPWARKADEAKAFIFLLNLVATPKWHHELVRNGGSYRFEFDKRLKFTPPPRIKESTNSRDQMLVCNREGWEMIGNKLDGYGRWWVEHVGYTTP